MRYCFEKELSNKGQFVCIVEDEDLLFCVSMKQAKQWHGIELRDVVGKMIQIANENGWKHEVYTQQNLIDVTEVLDSQIKRRKSAS